MRLWEGEFLSGAGHLWVVPDEAPSSIDGDYWVGPPRTLWRASEALAHAGSAGESLQRVFAVTPTACVGVSGLHGSQSAAPGLLVVSQVLLHFVDLRMYEQERATPGISIGLHNALRSAVRGGEAVSGRAIAAMAGTEPRAPRLSRRPFVPAEEPICLGEGALSMVDGRCLLESPEAGVSPTALVGSKAVWEAALTLCSGLGHGLPHLVFLESAVTITALVPILSGMALVAGLWAQDGNLDRLASSAEQRAWEIERLLSGELRLLETLV